MAGFIEKNKERLKAIIGSLVVIAVNVAAMVGVDVGDGDAITNAILIAFDMLAVAWGLWKNQNFTESAIESQKVLDSLKSIRKDTGVQVSAAVACELTGGVGHDDE